MWRRVVLMALLAASPLQAAGRRFGPAEPSPDVVRVAVIGGMVMTKMWDAVSGMFEADTGLTVRVVAAGPRPRLAKALREGHADLLTMHSGDITTDLVADGYGVRMRPWTRNDLVIVGPEADPAKIAGLKDGVEAFRRIAQAKAPFLDFRGNGSRELCHTLWSKAGIEPTGDWVLKDQSGGHLDVLAIARKHGACVVVGRMPVLFGKLKADGMRILVEGDRTMRRPYVVMQANPKRFPKANHKGAQALADYLLSEKVQRFLATFGAREHGGLPLFYPVWPIGTVNE